MADISITIPNENVSELTEGFTKIKPVPDGMSFLEHGKACIIEYITSVYEKGKKEIAKENAEIIDLGIT